MKLQKVQITNFRSVEDSGEFDIKPVTCLVGKNEAGKSAILLALSALNPGAATYVTLDKERDYPRRNLLQYEQIHENKDARVVRTIWQLDESEIQAINDDFGVNALKCTQIEISRCYGQDIDVSAKLNEAAILDYYLNLFPLNAAELSVLKPNSLETVDQFIQVLNDISSPTEKHQSLRNHLSEHGDPSTIVHGHVVRALPSFMYVSAYDRMDGAIQIEQTQARIQSGEIDYDEHRGSRLFVDFLDYAGVPLNSITDVSTFETYNARLQAASTTITDQLLEYWSQNQDLDVKVRIDPARSGDLPPFNTGTIARARIQNNLHRVDTPFSERSAGFVWFFSFLVKFAQIKKADTPIVLVLDEPGLSLHGRAQGDLLRFIDEKLAPFHQVIYSTHSPFMVPSDKLERVRIVEDKVDRTKRPLEIHGTKVSHDVLSVNADTLFPLQGALGYEVTQTLFVGKYVLLVEGPGDILYLQALSRALESRRRKNLDSRWTLCPAGGIDKIMPFISLFSGKGLKVAVLTDFAKGAKGKTKRIKKSEILKAGHCYTVADFTGLPESDIEDIFAPEVYLEIVNRSYNLSEPHCITTENLSDDATTTRLVKRVESMFNVMPKSIPEFNHYAPAEWLIQNPDILDGESRAVQRTLDVAEKIFDAFNELLDGNLASDSKI